WPFDPSRGPWTQTTDASVNYMLSPPRAAA
ncbi:MAG TPA: bifunctional 3-demethylubiquinol 3-O-methyltransferase/2-polyprenyl-6-hydroxyphenol methylase, partial [Rhodospirillum rubrum]|nr:bifunctional 3-demethylubiquinol 3-O-methyltransferase/2-polyprenyl-6-hydroxyphenol methylase [Rhodospirillum rubrum]